MSQTNVLGSIAVQITADLSGLRSGLSAASSEVKGAAGELEGIGTSMSRLGVPGAALGKVFGGIGNAAEEAAGAASSFAGKVGTGLKSATNAVNESFNQMQNLTFGIGGAFALAGGGLVALGVKAISMSSQLEQARISFTTMLGSAQAANDFIQQLYSFAETTPFEFKGLEMQAQQFLAFGFQAKDIIPTLTAVGDAMAGLGAGADVMNRVVYAMGQIHAEGKVNAGDMMQLAQAGIPAWDMLSKKIGVSIPEAMKKVSAGQVDSATALEALTTGMEAKFGGLMAKQNSTTAGLWSNLQDTVTQTLGVVGDKLTAALDLKDKISGITGAVSGLTTALAGAKTPGDFLRALFADLGMKKGDLADLSNSFNAVKNAMGAISSAVGGSDAFKEIQKFFGWLKDNHPDVLLVAVAAVVGGVLTAAFAALAVAVIAATWPILAIGAGLALLAVGVYLVVKNWGNIVGFFRTVWADVEGFFTGTWNRIRSYLSGVWSTVQGDVNRVWNGITGFFRTWGPLILAVLTGPIGLIVLLVTSNWQKIKDFGVAIWNAIKQGLTDLWNSLPAPLQVVFEDLVKIVTFFATMAWKGLVVIWTGIHDDVVAIATTIGTWLGDLWKSISDDISTAWTDVWKWLTDLWGKIQATATSVWNAISGAISGPVSTLMGWLRGTWNTVHNDAAAAWNAINGTANSVWNGIHGTITGWAQKVSDFVGGIFNGLGTVAHTGLTSLQNTVRGDLNWMIDHVLNSFVDAVNGSPLGKAGLHLDHVPHFAKGGIVGGQGNGDTQLGMLTPGEVVLSRAAVAGLGGPDAANSLNLGLGGASIGSIGGQCVAFVQDMLGIFFPGNANQWVGAPWAHTQTAAPGEVAVFTGGPYGHVAIVTGAGDGYNFPVIDSNWVAPLTVGTHVMNKGQYGFSTFLDVGKGIPGGIAGAVLDALNPSALVNGLVSKIGIGGAAPWLGGLPKGLLGMAAKAVIDFAGQKLGQAGSWVGRDLGFDGGGYLPPGYGAYSNATGRPEAVLTSSQWDAIGKLVAAVAQDGRGGRNAELTARMEQHLRGVHQTLREIAADAPPGSFGMLRVTGA